MDAQRMAYAAARGARLQFYWLLAEPLSGWRDCTPNIAHIRNDPDRYRIHPDDEHLQYGPLSSAMREAADFEFERRRGIVIYDPEKFDEAIEHHEMAEVALLSQMLADGINGHDMRMAGHEVRSLYMLFIAELLADEGL